LAKNNNIKTGFIVCALNAIESLCFSMVQQCLATQDKDKIGLWSRMDLEITFDILEWNKHNMREAVAIFLLLGIAMVESGEV
jgi:hypothetical protein